MSSTFEHTSDVALPEGVVTLLLADIEGSTSLWETRPDEMTTAIKNYDAVVSTTIAAHGGIRPVEQGEGDSFVAAFTDAAEALRCALDLQRQLASGDFPFRVRMALHAGEVQRRNEGNYIGPTINRCARLRAIAHGGQTVVSRSVHALVNESLPDQLSLTDMGQHRLRDLLSPEHVFLLTHPDVPVNPAPLRSLDSVAHNLPIELTSFVGREREVATVSELLRGNRIVTLLGTGGCGKTRLSLQVAAQSSDEFADGIWLVELAPIEDGDLVAQTVLASLGGREDPGDELVDTVAASIAHRAALLILDNCEHLVDATARVAAALLTRCPRLKILATSREALGVPGELTYTVPSLSVPAEGPTATDALATEAVDLFAERAMHARSDFRVTDDNAAAVGQICRRLDGIPLAIELAAARMRALSAAQIADGLDDRFRLLTTGARTLLPRQQTLRASVDWSFDLLTEGERVALRRLAVFASGFDLAAAEEVIGWPPIDPDHVLDLVASLVDKSLVLAEEHGGSVRYRMLETIRQYGDEHLVTSDERKEMQRRQRDHCRALLRRASAEEEGPDQVEWAARVRVELDNIRSALNSALVDDDGEALIELTCGTGNTWTVIGGSREHRRWLDEAMARAPADSPLRASALYQLGITDMFLGNMAASKQRLGESVVLYRSLGDEHGALWAHAEWAWAVVFADGLRAGRPLYDEGIAAARAAGESGALFSMEYGFAYCLALSGHPDEALVKFTALLDGPAPVEHFRQWAKGGLAMAMAMLGDLRSAMNVAEEVATYGRATGDVVVLIPATWTLGCARLQAGEIEAARSVLEESLHLTLSAMAHGMPLAHHGVSLLALADGDPAAALQHIDAGIELAGLVSPLFVSMLGPSRADVLVAIGDMATAKAATAEALQLARQWEAPGHEAAALITMARIARVEGQAHAAEDHGQRALAILRLMEHALGMVDAFEVLAGAATDEGRFDEAVRVLAAAEALRHRIQYRWRAPTQQREHDADVAKLRDGIGPSGFEAAWTQGQAMSCDEACDYVSRGRGERKRPPTGWAALTPAEANVAALVAEGLTNPQVGERLFISRHTVDTHLRHVYAKLGVSTRSELAALAARRDGADA
jgi:predicted ATPase/class 3 adenylate cyclase/DNA-binding CsgD family transcriptional regulator